MFPLLQVNGYIDPFYSPTVLIVPLPGAFRLTCYAYRKDYHRHLFRHPLGCSNPNRTETHEQPYTGERSALFQVENLHRYFLYAGIAILPFFYYDFYHSLSYAGYPPCGEPGHPRERRHAHGLDAVVPRLQTLDRGEHRLLLLRLRGEHAEVHLRHPELVELPPRATRLDQPSHDNLRGPLPQSRSGGPPGGLQDLLGDKVWRERPHPG